MTVPQAICVFVGAGTGACLRWIANIWFGTVYSGLHFGTLIANLLGCFLAGFFSALIITKVQASQELKLLILTGFLGGLTTFSALSVEIHQLMYSSRQLHALLTLSANLVGSLAMVSLGFYLCQLIWG